MKKYLPFLYEGPIIALFSVLAFSRFILSLIYAFCGDHIRSAAETVQTLGLCAMAIGWRNSKKLESLNQRIAEMERRENKSCQ